MEEKRYSFKYISDERVDELLSQGVTFEELEVMEWQAAHDLLEKQKEEGEK